MPELKYTKKDLEIMRSWTLERKIQVTQTRLIEWKARFDGKIYISFSGGKDSTVLADLTARIYAADQKTNGDADPLTLVFVNTGLEYPEIQRFTKEFAEWLRNTYEIKVKLETITPKMIFPEVLTVYGYPVISKEVAEYVYYARRHSPWAVKAFDGLDKHGGKSKFKQRYKKYKFMLPILELMPDRTRESVIAALDKIERRFGARRFRLLFRTITVDNGGEFADVERLERSALCKKKRTKIYFCHPYSSYERGSNENENKIIRRHFPKGTNFGKVTAAEVKRAERWIARYPRKILGWKTSEIVFNEYLSTL